MPAVSMRVPKYTLSLSGSVKTNITYIMELAIDQQARGTRIIIGDEAKQRRKLLNELVAIADAHGYEEIILPAVEPAEIYINKAGSEILTQMYVFPDKKGRSLCLRPEGTATIQAVADKHYKSRTAKLWYFERCYRYERPQAGRYREFFQFGMEIINPKDIVAAKQELIQIAEQMVSLKTKEFETNASVKRGLAYYIEDGFEISCPALGAQKQVCGGGAYAQGIGFAIGFDRLMLC